MIKYRLLCLGEGDKYLYEKEGKGRKAGLIRRRAKKDISKDLWKQVKRIRAEFWMTEYYYDKIRTRKIAYGYLEV